MYLTKYYSYARMDNMFVFNSVSFELPHKVCFKNFSVSVNRGSHVGIIGRNGCGKSSLLKIIHKQLGIAQSYLVPQIISDYPNLSGGERFNRKFSDALSTHPEVLLLDEPTNHLDFSNRTHLIRMLKAYKGTLLIATHDLEILKRCIDTIWHINNQEISIFTGNYDSFVELNKHKSASINKQLARLKQDQKNLKLKIMRQQERNSHSKASGIKKIKNKRWMKSVGNTKAMAAEKTKGRNAKNLITKQAILVSELNNLFIPEEVVPTFDFVSDNSCVSVAVVDGTAGYSVNDPVLATNMR